MNLAQLWNIPKGGAALKLSRIMAEAHARREPSARELFQLTLSGSLMITLGVLLRSRLQRVKSEMPSSSPAGKERAGPLNLAGNKRGA
jgi:hypothetical protein